jgi:cobalt/nickel transport system ATP-binding protein
MTTVYDDVAFGPQNYGYSDEETERRTMAALESVNIAGLKDRPVYTLSGGEKKLASIATVLSMEPDIILLDEPSVALDPKNRRNLINILNSIKCLKIIASHDLDFIFDTCERTLLMSDGRVAADDISRKILTDGELLERSGLELPLSMSVRQIEVTS